MDNLPLNTNNVGTDSDTRGKFASVVSNFADESALVAGARKQQATYDDTSSRKIVCRYGSGCTHVHDAIHRERFWHPKYPTLTGKECRKHDKTIDCPQLKSQILTLKLIFLVILCIPNPPLTSISHNTHSIKSNQINL